jgi:hypothetical protein
MMINNLEDLKLFGAPYKIRKPNFKLTSSLGVRSLSKKLSKYKAGSVVESK